MTIEADGVKREGRMFEVIVANGAFAAGGMRVAPDASPDDGLFDVVLIGDVSKADFVDLPEDLPRHAYRAREGGRSQGTSRDRHAGGAAAGRPRR